MLLEFLKTTSKKHGNLFGLVKAIKSKTDPEKEAFHALFHIRKLKEVDFNAEW